MPSTVAARVGVNLRLTVGATFRRIAVVFVCSVLMTLYASPSQSQCPAMSTTQSIAFGETVEASISSLGEVDCFTFDAVTGDVIRIRMSQIAVNRPGFLGEPVS